VPFFPTPRQYQTTTVSFADNRDDLFAIPHFFAVARHFSGSTPVPQKSSPQPGTAQAHHRQRNEN